MSKVEDVLSARPMGEVYPVSIATDAALVALKDAGKADVIWINVATLCRNLYDCIAPDHRQFMEPVAMGLEVMREMSVIRQVAADHNLGCQFYILGYEGLAKKYPFAKVHVAKTELQKARSEMISDALDAIMARDEGQTIHFDKGSEIRGEPKRALLISHYATDLLSRNKFSTLRLLESHTGAVKPRSQWNTKLTDGRSLGNIPFNHFTVQIFGDNRQHFDPYPHAVRKAILELAAAWHWTSITTVDKIRFSLQRMKDQYTAQQLLRVL